MIKSFEPWYWLTEASKQYLESGYISGDIKEHFWKMAEKAEKMLGKEGYAQRLYDNITKGWYLLPTPGITNFLDEKESAISCFGTYIDDTVLSLLLGDSEIGMMSKAGGGTSAWLNPIRPEGAPVSRGGFADGPMKYVKRLQETTGWINQSNRRGKVAVWMDVENPEIHKFLTIKNKTSEIHEVPFGVTIGDEWIADMKNGDKEKQNIWATIIKKKFETGFPYLFFKDNVNKVAPQVYKDKGMVINHSNLCTEIMLSNDDRSSFVCCIGAMNLVHYEEWKDTDAVEILVYLLDTFLTDFINKNENNPLMQRPVNFAREQRAIGVGFSGWHSYLQSQMIPVESMEAKWKNIEIFKLIGEQSKAASKKMALEYGKPLLLAEDKYEMRHVTTNAGAPNTSSGDIFGAWSQSIELLLSNYFIKALAKVKKEQKNYWLQQLLIEKGQDTKEVWDSIMYNNGSAQHLTFLSEQEKNVFKTATEVSPMELLIQQAQRQKYIDQGISFNTFVVAGTPAKEVSDYYLKAHEMGIKSLYYQLNQNAAQQFTRKSMLECDFCAG